MVQGAIMKKWSLILFAFLPQIFVEIISSFCFIIFRVNSSISIWTRSGRWQKGWWAARTGKRAWSSAGVEKGPWENTQMAEAARYHEIRGELFSFWTPQKGRLPCANFVGCWQYCRCQHKACRTFGSMLVNHKSVSNLDSAFTGEVPKCRVWVVWSLVCNPYACGVLDYILGLMFWVLNYASVLQILIGMIFYIPRAHVIC